MFWYSLARCAQAKTNAGEIQVGTWREKLKISMNRRWRGVYSRAHVCAQPYLSDKISPSRKTMVHSRAHWCARPYLNRRFSCSIHTAVHRGVHSHTWFEVFTEHSDAQPCIFECTAVHFCRAQFWKITFGVYLRPNINSPCFASIKEVGF